jgi:rubrerythrin
MYTLEDVFDMAIQLERNGHEFYAQAAACSQGDAKKLLTELADWERQHEKLFTQMRTDLPSIAPDAEAAEYIEALVEGKIFKARDAARQKLTGDLPADEILDLAIEMETSAMLFFLGMRQLADTGGLKVDQIIQEEMRHVSILTDQMGKF